MLIWRVSTPITTGHLLGCCEWLRLQLSGAQADGSSLFTEKTTLTTSSLSTFPSKTRSLVRSRLLISSPVVETLKSPTTTRRNTSSMFPSSLLLTSSSLTTPARLVTEWRIQKRVEEQFNAFIQGFHELVPADLVNVFDERELELLIGGISEIDVDDWMKNTDYRGYDEKDPVIQFFWKVRLNLCTDRCKRVRSKRLTRIHSASALGTLSKSLDSCNSQRVRLVSLSTDSRIFKVPMVLVVLRLKNLERTRNCQSRILVSTDLIYRLTRRTKPSQASSCGPLRRPWDSDRSREGGGGRLCCICRPRLAEHMCQEPSMNRYG